MVEKIILKDIREEEDRPNHNRGRKRPFNEFGNEHRKHFDEDKKHYDEQRKNVKRYGAKIIETKLFIDKEKLVEYVNEKGQSDALIDIFKIEEGLYKLVIKK